MFGVIGGSCAAIEETSRDVRKKIQLIYVVPWFDEISPGNYLPRMMASSFWEQKQEPTQ